MQKLKSALRKVTDFNLDARIPLITLLCFGAIVWGLNTLPYVIIFLNWLFLVFSVFVVIQSIKTGNWTKPVKKWQKSVRPSRTLIQRGNNLHRIQRRSIPQCIQRKSNRQRIQWETESRERLKHPWIGIHVKKWVTLNTYLAGEALVFEYRAKSNPTQRRYLFPVEIT